MNALRPFLAASLALALAACGSDDVDDGPAASCETEDRDDVYSMGMSKLGAAGYEVVLMNSTPAPPAKDDNAFDIQVLDDTGAAADGLVLDVVPFMPDHNHGTPIEAVVTPADTNGEYSATPVNLWMPGLWRVTVDIDDTAGDLDEVEFFFCIEG